MLGIGIDLGTSSVKVLAVDSASGEVRARVRRAYPTRRPTPGASEQSPGDWMAAVIGALGELATLTPTAQWGGIGLSAMLPTLVCLDADGEPVGPAIVWEDIRAESQARALAREYPEAVAHARTGQPIDGRYLVPMFRRIAESDPAAAARVTRIAGAKDYVFARLTGELFTDPSTAAGSGVYGLADGRYADGDWPELPEVHPSTELRGLDAGVARLVGARPGLPVALGAADSVLGAEALGARAGLDVAVISGTSTVILGTRATLEPDPTGRALVTPLARGGFGWELDLVATGSAFSWLAALTGADSVAELMLEAAAIDPGDAPEALPYLGAGEQGALWDPDLRGGFAGLTLGTTRGELMRGLLTGVVLEMTRCISVLSPPAGGRILVAGSSARAPVMLQDLADATGRTVWADLSEGDHSAIGAAQLLLNAIAVRDDLPESAGTAERLATLSEFIPMSERAELWAALAARHELTLDRERARVRAQSIAIEMVTLA